jgi:hypothetical protein
MYDAGKVGADNDNLLSKAEQKNQRQGDNSTIYLSIDFAVNDRLPKWCHRYIALSFCFYLTNRKSPAKIAGLRCILSNYELQYRFEN